MRPSSGQNPARRQYLRGQFQVSSLASPPCRRYKPLAPVTGTRQGRAGPFGYASPSAIRKRKGTENAQAEEQEQRQEAFQRYRDRQGPVQQRQAPPHAAPAVAKDEADEPRHADPQGLRRADRSQELPANDLTGGTAQWHASSAA